MVEVSSAQIGIEWDILDSTYNGVNNSSNVVASPSMWNALPLPLQWKKDQEYFEQLLNFLIRPQCINTVFMRPYIPWIVPQALYFHIARLTLSKCGHVCLTGGILWPACGRLLVSFFALQIILLTFQLTIHDNSSLISMLIINICSRNQSGLLQLMTCH